MKKFHVMRGVLLGVAIAASSPTVVKAEETGLTTKVSEWWDELTTDENKEKAKEKASEIWNGLVDFSREADEKINEKKSKERSKDIREDIERYCRTLADAINVPKTFIKLRDFVQVINRTGSETPRLVYMYQSALYLYNLERAYSPFNFYVVDTPNQQGQDTENLGSIFKSLELFLSDEGQVIVGTERETGMEEKASNVIKLTGKRRCLNNINYKKHIELLEKLQKTAISWVADNHNIQNEI